MKKLMLVAFAMLVITGIAAAQSNIPFIGGQWSTTVPGGVTPPPKGFTIDKLGAHQNGGRGCVGCHAPHSGARGNGGSMLWDGGQKKMVAGPAVTGDVGDEVLWGQDLGPVYANTFTFPNGTVSFTATSPERMKTGVAMCLSCHDGNVAGGAMMLNKSFEQAAGMLPAGVYGSQIIPTLLGADGGTQGNYLNDHPVGENATIGSLPIKESSGFFKLGSNTSGQTVIVAGNNFTNSTMAQFANNYGLYVTMGARAGAGFALDNGATLDSAYVVCTTCHTPHSMYTTTAQRYDTAGKKLTSDGTVPTFFFIAAPYNPGANVADGTKASSATQFCRQCHFTGAGGSNEGSGISIPTAF